jgi:hypothetical protein
MADIPEITHADLEGRIGAKFHTARHRFSADLYQVDWHGKPALLKDYEGRSWWVRRYWAPVLVGREFRTLRRLQGLDGVPRLYARVGSGALLMEHLQARRLPRDGEPLPDLVLFERLGKLIEQLHARGVGHGDLRRMNILMDEQAQPYLIDFETAVTGKEGFWGAFSRFGARRLFRVDRVALAKIKGDFFPDDLTAEERALIENAPWYLRVGTVFKHLYRYKKPRHRQRLKKDVRRWYRRLRWGRLRR